MAKQATVVCSPREIRWRRCVEAGTECPALLLCVPGQWQLDKLAGIGPVKISSRMIPGPDLMRCLQLENARPSLFSVRLVAALHESLCAPTHFILPSRQGVIVTACGRLFFLRIGKRSERARHAHLGVLAKQIGMTGCAVPRAPGSRRRRDLQVRTAYEVQQARAQQCGG